MMRTEDLRKVLPLWIKYTEDVRADPEVCSRSASIKAMLINIRHLLSSLHQALPECKSTGHAEP